MGIVVGTCCCGVRYPWYEFLWLEIEFEYSTIDFVTFTTNCYMRQATIRVHTSALNYYDVVVVGSNPTPGATITYTGQFQQPGRVCANSGTISYDGHAANWSASYQSQGDEWDVYVTDANHQGDRHWSTIACGQWN